jgi:uncharacterized protein YbjT (DUF2867 family)
MIIVTGASGLLGRAIIESLVRRMPAQGVGASVRDPAKVADLAQLGVRVRQGDFSEPESLRASFEGASQVLLVSSNARAFGGDTLAEHRHAIAAARSAGARRVVYTSQMAASVQSEFAPALDHAATEELLRESGLAWTALRNGFYAARGIAMLGDALTTGVLEIPRDGKTAWTGHADLADAAAAVLVQEGRFEGPTPPLTAAAALDLADLCRIASELTARPIRHQVISDEELRARLAAQGRPAHIAEIALGYYRASRNGEFSMVDGTLQQLIGRAPTTMQALMTRALTR